MTTPACKDCRFFAEVKYEAYYIPHDGLCSRYPPTMAVSGGTLNKLFPLVLFDEVCGEFEAREVKKDA